MTNNRILQKVIDDTERIFGRIAESYPRLLSEFENGKKQASDLMTELLYIGNDKSRQGGVRLNEHLENTKNESRNKLRMLDEFKGRNRNVLENLSAAIDNYSASQGYIEVIRDISESLQIVSLNALCNAVKAGKGGEGFSVITENLKSVTEDTIEKTSSLEKQGSRVSSSLEQFYIVEKEIDLKRSELLAVIEENVISGLDTFRVESETVSSLFKDLNSEAGKVKSAIQRIMQELQQQDILRQTIDQIILSIDELPSECENCASVPELTAEITDKAVFCVRLINLGIIMIDDVIAKIGETAGIFTENFRTARRTLEHIQAEKERAVRRFMKNLDAFERLAEMRAEVRAKAEALSSKRRGLIDLISEIIKHVGRIADEFESFDKISGWLQNVAVLSRIELSRSRGLEGMKESVDDMSDLVVKIQEQISKGEKETGNFISRTSGIFEEYKLYAEEEMHFLNNFTETFLDSISGISNINNTFSGVLRNFDFFTDDFCSLFDVSEKELDELKEITEDLNKVRTELACIEGKVKPQLEKGMHGVSINDWNIHDDEMNSIIKKFTIYSHKKTAGDFSGLEIEDSALDEGEVTLF